MTNPREENLRKILKQVNQNPQLKELNESKWHKSIHFLHNNSGYSIAKVAKAGSIAKHTDTLKSDLDVIFCTPKDYNYSTVLTNLEKTVKSNFSKVAEVKKGDNAVHINFNKPRINIDLVYLHNSEFNKEYEEMKEFGKLHQYKRDAIKLVKYSIYKAAKDFIKGYQIEVECANSNCRSLVTCVNYLIHHFKGILIKNGFKIDDILKYLT